MPGHDGKIHVAALCHFAHAARATALGQAGEQFDPRGIAEGLEQLRVKQFINRHAKAPPANRRLPVADTFVPTLRAIGSGQKGEPDEVSSNPRARSAVLRVAEKLEVAA